MVQFPLRFTINGTSSILILLILRSWMVIVGPLNVETSTNVITLTTNVIRLLNVIKFYHISVIKCVHKISYQKGKNRFADYVGI